MNSLNDIKKALDNNNLLNIEAKESISNLMNIFIKNMSVIKSDIDLDNFCNKLQTLNIKDKTITDEIIKYDKQENTIFIDSNKLNNGYDQNYLMMNELIKVIASKPDNTNDYGFETTGAKISLKALNKGYCEELTCSLLGNEGTIHNYLDEQIAIRLLGKVVSSKNFTDAYFENNRNYILAAFLDKKISGEKTIELVTKMDNNLLNRKKSNNSELGNIQLIIANMYFDTLSNELSKEEFDKKTNDFEANLYLNSNLFKESRPMYNNLDLAKKEYDLMKENYIVETYNKDKAI